MQYLPTPLVKKILDPDRDPHQNHRKNLIDFTCPKAYPSKKYFKNPSVTFREIRLTDRQTNTPVQKHNLFGRGNNRPISSFGIELFRLID